MEILSEAVSEICKKPVKYHDELQKLFSNQENVVNNEIRGNFQNSSAKVRSKSISSKSSHSSNNSNSGSSRASFAELKIKKQEAEMLVCQKKESHETKYKTTRTSKGTSVRNGGRKRLPIISRSAEQP